MNNGVLRRICRDKTTAYTGAATQERKHREVVPEKQIDTETGTQRQSQTLKSIAPRAKTQRLEVSHKATERRRSQLREEHQRDHPTHACGVHCNAHPPSPPSPPCQACLAGLAPPAPPAALHISLLRLNLRRLLRCPLHCLLRSEPRDPVRGRGPRPAA